jgi:hypothetical protein
MSTLGSMLSRVGHGVCGLRRSALYELSNDAAEFGRDWDTPVLPMLEDDRLRIEPAEDARDAGLLELVVPARSDRADDADRLRRCESAVLITRSFACMT